MDELCLNDENEILKKKLKCTVCEEIIEHYVLERYSKCSEPMYGFQVILRSRTRGDSNDSKPTKPTIVIYKCTKCGREQKMLDVFLEWMKG